MSGRRSRHTPPRRKGHVVGRLFYGIIGFTGELLVTAGVLLLLFIVWQLWWTDLVAGKEHEAVNQEISRKWGDTEKPTQNASVNIAQKEKGDPPEVASPAAGETFARVHIPRFGGDPIPMGEGVGLETVLNPIGSGHYPDSVLPGEVGNFSFAGHRTTYGSPLAQIEKLRDGDPVIVETKEAYFVYRVHKALIVPPTKSDVVAPVPGSPGTKPTDRLLTITTCHPMYSAAERYIVHATFDYWTKRDAGVPPDLAPNGG